MKKKIYRIITHVVSMIVVICILSSCKNERIDTFTSPNDMNKIKIEYDYASRPTLFYNDEKVWEYPNSGFNEEAYFYIEWEAEDIIKLKYDDESHNGKNKEEYRIELMLSGDVAS